MVIDTTAPTFTSQVRFNPLSAKTASVVLVWKLTFSEPMTGLDPSDFVVSGTTAVVASVTQSIGSTTAYDVRVTGGNIGSVNGGITLTGNTLANSFFSNAACADTLVGGAGNDRYFLNNATDRVIEIANGGTDVIYTTTSYTLAATTLVEDMRVYGAVALKLTGNSAANTLYGGVKADSLLGGAGADKLIGGAGRDLLYGGKDSAADLFIFNSRSESAVGTGRDLVTRANLIVSTTSNNQAMNESIRQVAATYLDGVEPTEGLLNHLEVAIRAYDPCLSCATHALGKMPLEVEVVGVGLAEERQGVVDVEERGGRLGHVAEADLPAEDPRSLHHQRQRIDELACV